MSANTVDSQQTSHHLTDVCSLALSASKMRAVVLHDNEQFSRASEHHLVELTRFDSTTVLALTTQSFTNKSQLSQYLCSSASGMLYQSNSVEI